MKNSFSYKWVVTLFFSAVGIAFTASLIYLAAGYVDPDTYWGRKMTLPKFEDTTQLRSVDKYVLELDQAKRIKDRIFFYQGRKDDYFLVNVIIPEIDRQYPYPFKINIPAAKNGVEVAGLWLQLITIRSNFISVKLMER